MKGGGGGARRGKYDFKYDSSPCSSHNMIFIYS